MTAPLTLALSPTGERGSGGRLGQLGYLCGSAERGNGLISGSQRIAGY